MSFNGYLYAIALGFDVPLVSLLNVQRMLYPYNQVTSRDAKMQLGVVSEMPNFAPVRLQSLDAQESRDGVTYLSWNMMLTNGGVSFWLNYLFSAAVASVTGDISIPVTIYTRQAQFSSYTRQNAYAIYPTTPSADNNDPDLVYSHRRGLFSLRQRFNDLTASA